MVRLTDAPCLIVHRRRAWPVLSPNPSSMNEHRISSLEKGNTVPCCRTHARHAIYFSYLEGSLAVLMRSIPVSDVVHEGAPQQFSGEGKHGAPLLNPCTPWYCSCLEGSLAVLRRCILVMELLSDFLQNDFMNGFVNDCGGGP